MLRVALVNALLLLVLGTPPMTARALGGQRPLVRTLRDRAPGAPSAVSALGRQPNIGAGRAIAVRSQRTQTTRRVSRARAQDVSHRLSSAANRLRNATWFTPNANMKFVIVNTGHRYNTLFGAGQTLMMEDHLGASDDDRMGVHYWMSLRETGSPLRSTPPGTRITISFRTDAHAQVVPGTFHIAQTQGAQPAAMPGVVPVRAPIRVTL